MRVVKPFRAIPGPTTLPIIGNLWQYKIGMEDPIFFHKILDDLYTKYGPLVKQKLGKTSIVHVYSPEDAKTIYQHEGKLPHIMPLQDSIFLYRKQESLTLGLGNSNGDEWYKLRDSLKHLMLTPKGIQTFMNDTDIITHELIENIKSKMNKNGNTGKLKDELSKWSLETAGMMCFGKRLGYMKDEKRKHVEGLLKANKSVFYLSTILKFSFPIHEYGYSPVWKELHHSESQILRETISNTKKALQEIEILVDKNALPNSRFNFLTTLLRKENITESDIYILCQSLFTDGLSTTVPSLIYNIYCLAAHPDKQEKSYQEISKLMKNGETVTNEILNNLPFIKSVVKETFRLYPIGTEISRIIKTDMVLSGYEVPKETHVNINMNLNFMSEKYFDDAKYFKPERWLRINNPQKLDPFVLTPFGHGARTCLGRRFAEQNLYIALIHILLNFKIGLKNPNTQLEQIYNVLLFPSGISNIYFEERK